MVEQQRKSVSPESKPDLEASAEIGEKQKEIIREKLELAEQKHNEKLAEHEALNDAKQKAEESDKELENQKKDDAPREKLKGAPSKKQLSKTFDAQMKGVQEELNPGSRILSKIIHSRIVESSSDFVGSTLARPNAMLTGSIVAFVTITLLYFFAKHFGYRLSGFETVAAFAIGWVLGIVYDYFKSLSRNK